MIKAPWSFIWAIDVTITILHYVFLHVSHSTWANKLLIVICDFGLFTLIFFKHSRLHFEIKLFINAFINFGVQKMLPDKPWY